MNLPPPPPLTANELLENTVRVMMEEGLGEHTAYYKAGRAIARLMAIGALEEWGMSAEGEMLFVQAEPRPEPIEHIVYIVPIRFEEE